MSAFCLVTQQRTLFVDWEAETHISIIRPRSLPQEASEDKTLCLFHMRTWYCVLSSAVGFGPRRSLFRISSLIQPTYPPLLLSLLPGHP